MTEHYLKQFITAIYNRDVRVVSRLIKRINIATINNVFKKSIEHGHYDILKLLIIHGADIHADGILMAAAGRGYYNIVQLLIKNGADVCIHHNIALKIAVYRGHYNIVELLIKNGADIHAEKGIILQQAAQYGHYKISDLLIKNGVYMHEHNYCALTYAMRERHYNIVILLIEYGANISTWDDFCIKHAIDRNDDDFCYKLLSYYTVSELINVKRHGNELYDKILHHKMHSGKHTKAALRD